MALPRAHWLRSLSAWRPFAGLRTLFRGSTIVAAQSAGGGTGWRGTDEDANRDYLEALDKVIQRSQDLHFNNPDVRGFSQMRTAHMIGAGVRYRCTIRGDEIGIDHAVSAALNARLNRLRELWSISGHCDQTGQRRTEGKLQEIAILTALVHGSCLVHRVFDTDPGEILPLDLEIIPGWRIQTPLPLYGDATISYGVKYTDDRRTKIEGYWVRKPSKSLPANSFLYNYTLDDYAFIPRDDAALLRLTEPAGLDRSMPATVAVVKALRNKNEFADAALAGARKQATRAVAIEVEQGANAWDRAADDAAADDAASIRPAGWVATGEAETLYMQPGEKVVNLAANLPTPDFAGFMDYHDRRCARGLNTSVSRFSRNVDNSYSGGRLEDQIDQPGVAQLREDFTICWNRVHEWFLQSAFLAGVPMPNYGVEMLPYYAQAQLMWPQQLDINPVDTQTAREKAIAIGTLTPQQACEMDGKDYEENLRQRARALRLQRELETEYALPPGSLGAPASSAAPAQSLGRQDDAIAAAVHTRWRASR